MVLFFKILDWFFVIVTVIGIAISLSLLANIIRQRSSWKESFKYVIEAAQRPRHSFEMMWFSITVWVGVIYFSERFDMVLTFNLTLVLTILYMFLGTAIMVGSLVARIFRR